jgi:hypothetical protein
MIQFLCMHNSFLQGKANVIHIGPILGNYLYHAVKGRTQNLLILRHLLKVMFLISGQMVSGPDRKSGFCKLAQNHLDVVVVATRS